MSVGYDKIAFQTNERKQMTTATLQVGQTFTTTKSGIVGVIKEIHAKPNGVNRLLLDVNGSDRWTSVSAN